MLADADDEEALHQMTSQAKVVASTVGPYALYGSSAMDTLADQDLTFYYNDMQLLELGVNHNSQWRCYFYPI